MSDVENEPVGPEGEPAPAPDGAPVETGALVGMTGTATMSNEQPADSEAASVTGHDVPAAEPVLGDPAVEAAAPVPLPVNPVSGIVQHPDAPPLDAQVSAMATPYRDEQSA